MKATHDFLIRSHCSEITSAALEPDPIQAVLLEPEIDDPFDSLCSNALSPPTRLDVDSNVSTPVLCDPGVEHDLPDESIVVGRVIRLADTLALSGWVLTLDDELYM
jgi:hypothetical protein